MSSIFRFFIRISSFLRKEIFEILRQPRLIASLVLGPFMILLLFGIGYRNEAPRLRTMFVIEAGSPLEAEIEQYADSLGQQLIFAGITANRAQAEQELRQGDIDLIAVAPEGAFETIQAGEQATFTLIHNEIDPFQSDYIGYFGKVYIDEVNRRILQSATEESQETALTARQSLGNARGEAQAMREALESGDAAAARDHQRRLDRELSALEFSIGGTVEVLDGVQQTLGGESTTDVSGIRRELAAVRQATGDVGAIEEGQSDYDEQALQADEVEDRLAVLDETVGTFEPLNSRVIVSPFRSETATIAESQPLLQSYFAPAVIVLLLQHLAVTFAALSIVREMQLGTIELFRVSPVSSGEALSGKYLSYLLFGGVIAFLLTLLVVFIPLVPWEGNWLTLAPMLGNWANFALVIFGLLFASLGFGFVISLTADTDSQAVQFAMIVLLSSVFFSGFFLRLEMLWAPVRTISWSLPATYAIKLLQDIMLRGQTGDPLHLVGLFGIGGLLYVLSWFLMGRRMARE